MITNTLAKIEATFDGPTVQTEYHHRIGTQTLGVLTVLNESDAREIVAGFADEIIGKTVVEIGAGVGFLSLEMARHAKQVWAIECDVAWSWAFVKHLYAMKPQNLSWIFGSAENVVPWLRADVAVLRTRSGVRRMVEIAKSIAPRIVLSSCDEPLIADAGSDDIAHIAEYIDRRVDELLAQFA